MDRLRHSALAACLLYGVAPASANEECRTSSIAYRLPACEAFFRSGGQNRPTAAAQTAPSVDLRHWDYASQTDRITRVRSEIIRQTNTSGEIRPHRRPERRGIEASLTFMCRGKDAEVVVAFDDQLVAGYRTRVTYRIDDRPAVSTMAWDASTDSSAVGLWQSGPTKAFFRQLATGQKLVFRIEQTTFGTSEAEFNLSGALQATEPLRSACGWPASAAPAPGGRKRP